MAKQSPTAADALVGANIRRFRLEQGLTQTELADHLGLTFQQVQKYEKGANRVGAGRLIAIARFLGVTTQQVLGVVDETPGKPDLLRELGQTRMGVELARAFSAITAAEHREALVRIARALAGDNLRRAPVVTPDTAPHSAADSASHPPPQMRAPSAARPIRRAAGRAEPGS